MDDAAFPGWKSFVALYPSTQFVCRFSDFVIPSSVLTEQFIFLFFFVKVCACVMTSKKLYVHALLTNTQQAL